MWRRYAVELRVSFGLVFEFDDSDEHRGVPGRMEEDRDDPRQRLSDIGIAITLCGVVLNMGLTIGLGVNGPLPLRLGLAFAVPIGLLVALALVSRKLRLLSQLPWWLTERGPDPWDRFKSKDDQSGDQSLS